MICGTCVLGPIGAAILLYGLLLMKRAERAGAQVRPWAITLVGGFILVDTSVNMVAWGFDLGPAHDTLVGRSRTENTWKIFDAIGAGFLGFCVLVSVPFLGRLVLLPYVHTVRGEDWGD